MQVMNVRTPLLHSNMYFILENRRMIVIDPYSSAEVINKIEKAADSVDYLILTHEHYDHISGANDLRDHFGCPIVCSGECGQRICDPRLNQSRHFDAFCTIQSMEKGISIGEIADYICHADFTFKKKKHFHWQDHVVDLIETPGHSKGSICIVVDEKMLFSGDTLFLESKTYTRFRGGSETELKDITFPLLKKLPSEAIVYPGHYDQFRLKEYKYWI
ncbi:Zn-dependent hydrolase, glyoxylase [Desulfitobacterium dichloroeliminans LMG P-21439]|uniref:Zn-dependent hydrolase, glyoxylase n=1 Tax=Desulfitobacterium dichloroeliminans (strain LMG P-21439 / DCA1) TaxID=871963 RepID=L0FCD1_DESDL|nr:MBL fold metallo-hydrolase [Desulfitobacterium dichloroeliminans]AGA70593.1 Zn-dependent hydrolase, glyoxylase [Desulfitobacterium dichloroeliminans LMG P-21439]